MKFRRSAVLLAHFHRVGLAVLDRFQGGFLADDAGAEHRILMDAHHGVNNSRRAAGVTDAKTGHGVGLGKTVQENRPLLHAGERGDADVFAFKGQLGIDFVSDDQQVAARGQRGDFLQLRAAHGSAGRVGGEIQHQRLAFGSNGFFDGRRRHGKGVFRAAGDGDGTPPARAMPGE